MKITLKKTGSASRKDAYTMNPKDIVVIWEENPRKNYGDESFKMLKESIRVAGEIINPLMITPTEDNEGWKLSHGFRRMKAILELADEGFVIESVRVQASKNQEEILVNHIILNNTTKELDDVELADCLRQLSKMIGDDNMQTLSKRTGIPYAKVRILLGFAESAGTILKDAVKKDEISFSAATEIAQNSNNIDSQVQILDAAKKGAELEGKKRVSSGNVNKVLGKSEKLSKDLQKLRTILCRVGEFENVVMAIDNIGLDQSEIISILNPEYHI